MITIVVLEGAGAVAIGAGAGFGAQTRGPPGRLKEFSALLSRPPGTRVGRLG